MGSRNFGVKEIDLTGASGVPTIDSPNNLNINAVNVAISTDITVAGKVSLGAGTSISSHANNELQLGTNNVERLRIGAAGQWGLGGANYGSSGQVLTSNGSGAAPTWQAGGGGSGYGDSNVDTHLNRSTANTNEVLSWNGSDYDWVANAGGGYGDSNVDTHLNRASAATGEVLSWNGSDYDWVAQSGGGSGGITDGDKGDITVSASGGTWTIDNNVITTGKIAGMAVTTAKLDDNAVTFAKFQQTSQSNVVLGRITTLGGNVEELSGANVRSIIAFENSIDAHLNQSNPTSGHVLSWNGSDYAWVAQSGGGSGSASDSFKTIAVSGQSDVVADSATDTLTLIAGSNMTITTNATGDTITLASSAGGTGLAARTSAQVTTASLNGGADGDATITAAKSYILHKLVVSHPAWVRVYVDAASRTADASRAETSDPDPGSGVIAEVITTGTNETVLMTPGVVGFNNDGTPSNNMYLAVKNKDSTARAITVTAHFVQLEA